MQTTEIAKIFKVAVQHHQAGRLDRAEELYGQVLEIAPNHPAGLHCLAVIASERGEYDLAIELAGKAIEEMPKIPQFYNTIGAAFDKAGRVQEALDAYRQAISLKPDYTDAYNNLANILYTQKQYDEAIEIYMQVVRLKPDFAEAYYNLGIILNKMGRYTEAIENYKRTIQLKPDCGEVYDNMAVTLIWQGHYTDAVEKCRQAIGLKPDYAEAYNTMASAFMMQGRYDEAIENYRQTVQLAPDYATAHFNMGIALLLTGEFIEGWKEYEWRPSVNNNIPKPRWDGSSFVGKRLLVFCEQGLGDSLHLLRYLPMVKERGGTVIFRGRKPILALLRQFSGIDELVEVSPEAKRDIKFDYHVSLLSLPGIFATTLETIPSDVPYLCAEQAKAEYWREKLCVPEFKVGIVWAGASIYKNDHNRSCMLKDFAPLAGIDGVHLYGLQKGARAVEVESLPDDMVVTNLGEQFEDFADTAGAIENLDLVVSVDTAVLHLAGAMGKPTWALLPFSPDWRWLLNRQDSPWYPTMKLFRQKEAGRWHDVFTSVRKELQTLVDKQKTTR